MWKALRTVRKYLWHYRAGLAVGGACLVAKDVAQALQPLMIRGAVDSFRGGGSLFFRYAGFLVALALVKGLFQYWMRVILIGVSRDIEFDLRNDLYAHLIRLSPEYYARTRTGDIMARATNDLNAVRTMLGPGVMYWFETTLTFVLAIAIMVSVDWRLAAFAVMPAPAVSFAVVFFGRRIHDRFEKLQEMFSDISSRVQENLSGVRMVRAFVQEEAEMRRFAELNRQYIARSLKLVRIQGLFEPLLEALIGLTFLVVLWVGGQQVLNGRISVGSFVMFNTYMGMLVWPMIAFGWVVNLTQRGSASLQRINEILHEEPSIAAPADAAHLGVVRGDIEFQGVTVDYGSGLALAGVDLRIPAGRTIAIVGRTGSGKSTLVNLAPRLMDPTSGAVLLDGIDVRRLDPAELRGCIGFVPQETFLFSATIAENIAFGVDHATEEEIRRAAEMAGLAAISRVFRKGTGRWWASAGLRFREGRSSGPRSRARCCAIPAF